MVKDTYTFEDIKKAFDFGVESAKREMQFLQSLAEKPVTDAPQSMPVKDPISPARTPAKRGHHKAAKAVAVMAPLKELLSAGGAMTVAEIAKKIGAKRQSISVALQNLKNRGSVVNEGGIWRATNIGGGAGTNGGAEESRVAF